MEQARPLRLRRLQRQRKNNMAEEVKLPIAYSISLYNIIEKLLFVNGGVPAIDKTTLKERELPFNLKYKLHRNYDILLKDYSYFELQRANLVKQYGAEEDGKITVKDENIEKYKQDLLKAINIEVSHSFIKLTQEEIDKMNFDINISSEEMNLFISFMVEDDTFLKDLQTPIDNVDVAKEVIETDSN